MSKKKLSLISIIITLVVLWFAFDLSALFTLETIKEKHQVMQTFIDANFLLASLSFFAAYVLMTALSLPGAAIATLLGAALFGFWWALLLVSFASTLGATAAFLVSRTLLRETIQTRFATKFAEINQGINENGAMYLFSLRLIPIFPFFLINLLMGLTAIRTRTFYAISQIGMLPGTVIYINAGTQLTQIDSIQGIVSPSVLLSLALLGIFPILTKKTMSYFSSRKLYKQWQKPDTFSHNLIVIGAGSGGLVSSYIAAAVKAKVALIEKNEMGGDCLNTGCVPSKALIRVAHHVHETKQGAMFGVTTSPAEIDFPAVMARVHEVITQVEPHDSVERYTELGVECIKGEATLISPWQVSVNGETLSSKNIIIATGARPLVPKIEGIETVNYLTSDTIWQLNALPAKLLILGGGPIGCELAQSFARLGSAVTQVEMGTQLLQREDNDAASLIMQKLVDDKVNVLLGHKAIRFENNDGVQSVVLQKEPTATSEAEEIVVTFDYVMLALGRVANTSGFGLDTLGIGLNPNGTIQTNAYLQTNYPNIYAVGDVAGPFQLTHAASHQAWYASVNSLFGRLKKFKADYSVLPAVTFTSPELARVGITEKEAIENNIAYDVTLFEINELDRAIADGEDCGYIKVLTTKNSDKIIGVTIVSDNAGNLLAEFTLAMRHNLGLNKILGTIHPYPTMSEAVKYTAGVWKRNHAPQKLLSFAEKFHGWMRN